MSQRGGTRKRPSLYEILQVSPNAEAQVIQASYRVLARRYHPDLNSAPEAVARMRELNSAYAVLSDAHRRAQYDAARGWLGRPPIREATSGNGRAPGQASRLPQAAAASRARLILVIIALIATLTLIVWLLIELLTDTSVSLLLAATNVLDPLVFPLY